MYQPANLSRVISCQGSATPPLCELSHVAKKLSVVHAVSFLFYILWVCLYVFVLTRQEWRTKQCSHIWISMYCILTRICWKPFFVTCEWVPRQFERWEAHRHQNGCEAGPPVCDQFLDLPSVLDQMQSSHSYWNQTSSWASEADWGGSRACHHVF